MSSVAGLNIVAGVLSDGSGNVLGASAAHPLFMSLGTPALASAVAAGTAVTAASETTLLPSAAKVTLPANFFKVGTKLRINASGLISSLITTPGTARFKVKLGPTAAITVFDGLAIVLDSVAAHVNDGWRLTIDLTCRAVGASTSANLWGDGEFASADIIGFGTAPTGNLVANLPWNSAPAVGTGFDSTVANILDLTFTQTAATGSITLEQYSVTQVA